MAYASSSNMTSLSIKDTDCNLKVPVHAHEKCDTAQHICHDPIRHAESRLTVIVDQYLNLSIPLDELVTHEKAVPFRRKDNVKGLTKSFDNAEVELNL